MQRFIHRSGLLVLLIHALWAVPIAHAKRPAAYDLLPSKTLAYLRVVDVHELSERFDETSFGRMMQEQQLESLSAQLFQELETAFAPAADRLGLTIEELIAIPQGEITLAVVAPPSGLPALVLMMDIDGQEGSVQKIWDLADQGLESRMTRSDELERGTRLTIFSQDDPRWTGLVRFQKEGLLVVSSNLEVAKQILAAWDEDDEQKVLRQNQDFADVMRHSKGPRGESPQLRWFIDPVSLAKVSFRGNLGAQTFLATLPVIGLDGVLALGGSLTLASDEYDSFAQAHLITAEPRTGILEMLAVKSGDPTPEPWVPHDVASYQTLFWDLKQTKNAFQKLYDSFRGDDAFVRDFVDKSQDRFGVDITAGLTDAWGGRVSFTVWFERPARLQTIALLGGFQLKEDHKFEDVIEKVVERVGTELEERTFAGVTYYASPELGEPVEAPADGGRPPEPNRVCFGIVGDYVLLANRTDVFERGIITSRTSGKRLEDELDFRLTAGRLRRQPGGNRPGYFVFRRPEENLRVLYDLAIADSTRQRLAEGAERTPFLGKLQTALEENPLPPFATLRKYLAPAGGTMTVDDTGFHYTGFSLRRK